MFCLCVLKVFFFAGTLGSTFIQRGSTTLNRRQISGTVIGVLILIIAVVIYCFRRELSMYKKLPNVDKSIADVTLTQLNSTQLDLFKVGFHKTKH